VSLDTMQVHTAIAMRVSHSLAFCDSTLVETHSTVEYESLVQNVNGRVFASYNIFSTVRLQFVNFDNRVMLWCSYRPPLLGVVYVASYSIQCATWWFYGLATFRRN
jgi:hypothetical protein